MTKRVRFAPARGAGSRSRTPRNYVGYRPNRASALSRDRHERRRQRLSRSIWATWPMKWSLSRDRQGRRRRHLHRLSGWLGGYRRRHREAGRGDRALLANFTHIDENHGGGSFLPCYGTVTDYISPRGRIEVLKGPASVLYGVSSSCCTTSTWRRAIATKSSPWAAAAS